MKIDVIVDTDVHVNTFEKMLGILFSSNGVLFY